MDHNIIIHHRQHMGYLPDILDISRSVRWRIWLTFWFRFYLFATFLKPGSKIYIYISIISPSQGPQPSHVVTLRPHQIDKWTTRFVWSSLKVRSERTCIASRIPDTKCRVESEIAEGDPRPNGRIQGCGRIGGQRVPAVNVVWLSSSSRYGLWTMEMVAFVFASTEYDLSPTFLVRTSMSYPSDMDTVVRLRVRPSGSLINELVKDHRSVAGGNQSQGKGESD